MRYGIFSDVHSNLEALESILNALREESIDTYLCIGDVVGYAANPCECIRRVKDSAAACVAGNHDWASVDLLSTDYFNTNAKTAIQWTRRKLEDNDRYFLESLKLTYGNDDLTLVHGTLNGPEDFNYMIDNYNALQTFKLLETDICFVGHSHIAGFFIKDKDNLMHYREDNLVSIKRGFKYIINVGSVGQPRDGNPKAAYCIYDTDKKEVQIKRVNYAIETTRKKIIDAGLPKFLADRLLIGR
jgi:predicted phosphodiesterase